MNNDEFQYESTPHPWRLSPSFLDLGNGVRTLISNLRPHAWLYGEIESGGGNNTVEFVTRIRSLRHLGFNTRVRGGGGGGGVERGQATSLSLIRLYSDSM